ncbi:MAG: elongation factor 4 [Candidatus Omnitrophica bacterium CG11_big_fil_rev_8_21_14_0_20_42_13]|uniref:Elongation factor 4 n=1 Tax=Candidatus Ghiorseimicrobium undicola TaxID=1974746 RepID=A0A2H0LZK0_9BACT|nr:MAG: elongation factor 4 [Candidatus Omnitrophica bacterium CG11_big_fil_rev_8_21_14_0_20_42_13]
MDKSLIRNFSIIAHIDHGKSTLADRLIERTCSIDRRQLRSQMLDDMDLERERGITIKASAACIGYKAKDGKNYIFNLIDTPGHVDFTYEVSKSIAACEGALLVVDASQGIEAQTVANFYLAKEHNLSVIPVINKIDLPSIDLPGVKRQLVDMLRFKEEDLILASAKEGVAIDEILERIVSDIPPPGGDASLPLQALVFDSVFDVYRGVIVYLRLVNGTLRANDTIIMMQKNSRYRIEEIGVVKDLKPQVTDVLTAGEVGYFIANIRAASDVMVGDTVTGADNPAKSPLAGYKEMKPLVFCGIYPVNSGDFSNLREAMEKLKLSDASFVYEPESSISFGHGFRCGFLGLLHMEIVQERLEREYDLNLVITTPNVAYMIKKKTGDELKVDNPAKFPESFEIAECEEPYVKAYMLIPTESLNSVCELAKDRRGIYDTSEYLTENRVKVIFDIPLSEIIVDFYDKLKSLTRGYGSLDYEFEGYFPADIVRLDILINKKICDAFSCLVHKEKAQLKGRALVGKLKELIPRQLFEVSIQAAIGSQIIAAERVRPVGKNVTAKCYGGDITRKRKLWEKQKAGKKRMKQFGSVEIPQEAFLAALRV